MLNIYFGNIPDAIYNTEVYFQNVYDDEWITDTGKDVGYSNSLLYGFEVPYATPVEVHEYPTYTLLFPL